MRAIELYRRGRPDDERNDGDIIASECVCQHNIETPFSDFGDCCDKCQECWNYDISDEDSCQDVWVKCKGNFSFEKESEESLFFNKDRHYHARIWGGEYFDIVHDTECQVVRMRKIDFDNCFVIECPYRSGTLEESVCNREIEEK